MIAGKGGFCSQKDLYSCEAEEDGYFDMEPWSTSSATGTWCSSATETP